MGPLLLKSIERPNEACQIQLLLNSSPLDLPQPPLAPLICPSGPPRSLEHVKISHLIFLCPQQFKSTKNMMTNNYFYNLSYCPPGDPLSPPELPLWGLWTLLRPKLVHIGPLLPKPIEKTSETYQIQVLLNKPPLGPLSPPDMTLLDPKGSRTSKNIKSYIVESLEKQIRQKSS